MRESGFWSRGSGSYRSVSRPAEPSRSRYDSRPYDRPDFDDDQRAFPPPSANNYGSSNYNNSSPMDRPSRDMRYGDGDGRMGPHNSGMGPQGMGPSQGMGPGPQGMGPSQGPMMGPGPGPMGGGGGMDSGPRGNQPPMMNQPGGGGMPSGGNSGYGGGGGGGGGAGGPNQADLYSSIQTLSQMNAQQNDIAAKLISAVLSTNLVGNMGNQQGPPFPPGKMGGGYDDRKPFPSARSPPMHGGGPRQFGTPGRYEPSRFEKFSRERRGRSPRATFSGRLFKSGFDRRPTDMRKRPASDLRGRLGSKRSWSDGPAKDDTSKFKRHRRSSERSDNGERREKGGRDEERTSAGKNESDNAEEDGDKSKDKEEDLPTEALYCHMCKHGNFTSEKTYLFHLDGVRHRKTAVAFHAKNEATLEYLRKNAKLASIRFGGMDNSVTPSRCSICTALVKENFFKHKKILEHRVVKKFLRPKCCGRFFKTRYDMDEHRLSLPHLKNIYKGNEKNEITLDDSVKGEGSKWSFEEALKHLRSRNPIEDRKLSLENIPPFDGNSFIGVEFLQAQDAVLCRPCQVILPIGVKGLESHMTSIDHYNTVLDYLREQKKKGLDSSATTKEEEGEGEVGNSEKKEKSGRGKDSDDEDEDDDDDDDDDDAVAEEVHSLEDDTEKELPFIDEDDHIVLEEVDGEDGPLKEVGEDVE